MIKLTGSDGKATDFSPEFKKNMKFGQSIGTHDVIVFDIVEKKKRVVRGKDEGDLFGSKSIPNNDEIWDKWAEKAGEDKHGRPIYNGKKVKVTYIQDGHTEAEPGLILFDKNEQCKITITGWNHKQFELLWYLRISSVNKSNPLNADDRSVKYIFQETEPEKDAQSELATRRERRQTEDAIEKSGQDELAGWMQSVNQPVTPIHDQNKITLMKWLDSDAKNFKKFQSISSDVRTEISQLIRRAENKGAIQYIKRETRWRIIGPDIEIVKVLPNQEEYDALISFLHTEKKGENMMTIIKNECEGKAELKEEKPNTEKLIVDPEKEEMAEKIKSLEGQLKAKNTKEPKAKAAPKTKKVKVVETVA